MLNQDKYDKKVSNNAKFYTASAAVYSVLEDLQYGEERFNQFLKWALDGVSRLTFDILHEVHVEEFEMKPWKQISFPPNMVDWSKIGFRTGGQIKVFTKDSGSLKLFDKVNCVPQENKIRDLHTVESSDTVVPFYTAGFFGSAGDHYYGSVLNYNYTGYFDVDEQNRVFNFKRTVNNINKVYLEYISDGINPTGFTVIHPYAFQALQLYIHWKRKEYDDRYGEGERDRAQRLFEQEEDKVLLRKLDLSIEDILEALRSGYGQTVKN